MKKSNINFKENTKVTTQKSIKHATFYQTDKKGSDFMDRKHLENTTFFRNLSQNKFCRKKIGFFALTLPEFICFIGTKTLTQTKIEEIKHKFQRKHKSCEMERKH